MTGQDRKATGLFARGAYRVAWPFFVRAPGVRSARKSDGSGLTQDDVARLFEDELRASNDWPNKRNRAMRGVCPRHA